MGELSPQYWRATVAEAETRELLTRLFHAAVAVCLPAQCLPRKLPPEPKGKTVVVGAGKAAAAMALEVDRIWAGLLSGFVVAPAGYIPKEYAKQMRRIKIRSGSHPNPRVEDVEHSQQMLANVQNLSAGDLVLALISGGGSSLLPYPAIGLDFGHEYITNGLLVKSGAPIGEMNCVRKHISRIKGGQLAAAAYPAQVLSLIISDVPGDNAPDVASGPTLPDASTFADALAVIEKHGIGVPKEVLRHLLESRQETPKKDDFRLANTGYEVIATSHQALAAAMVAAERLGLDAEIIEENVEDSARAAAVRHAEICKKVVAVHRERPILLLSGGETTVKVTNKKGKGGRNGEYALALAVALNGAQRIHALAADTDGIDGTQQNAGAFIGPDTLQRASSLGLDAGRYLANNDSFTFFEAVGELFSPGPTLTNVNDFRAILIEP